MSSVTSHATGRAGFARPDARAWWPTIAFFQKAYWRRPVVAVVSFLVPLVFSVGFPLQAQGRPVTDGMIAPRYAMTGMMGWSAVFTTYIVVQAVCTRRDVLFYKRLRAQGVGAGEIFAGELACAVLPFAAVVTAGAVAGSVAGAGGLGARWVFVALVALAVGVLHVLLGLAISSLIASLDLAMFVVSPILIASLYLSGVTFSVHELPPQLAEVARFLPLSAGIDLLRTVADPAYHVTLPWWADLACLVAWAVAFAVVVAHRFSWDPRRTS